ncbi:hypothetical protein K504DRAFT_494207 [Pleomassaria siparia CBS 279.74]|uniref:Uncharacterized protein n=1 Tax=Pleomassaria siparia CBS 279.74 TaxID=1314801 RepID=A0A6G1JXT8_9PLEO|nr:hypothetical protein K504DRAFT_494207 [Pleomassaria siparia CBS 279.74]
MFLLSHVAKYPWRRMGIIQYLRTASNTYRRDRREAVRCSVVELRDEQRTWDDGTTTRPGGTDFVPTTSGDAVQTLGYSARRVFLFLCYVRASAMKLDMLCIYLYTCEKPAFRQNEVPELHIICVTTYARYVLVKEELLPIAAAQAPFIRRESGKVFGGGGIFLVYGTTYLHSTYTVKSAALHCNLNPSYPATPPVVDLAPPAYCVDAHRRPDPPPPVL